MYTVSEVHCVPWGYLCGVMGSNSCGVKRQNGLKQITYQYMTISSSTEMLGPSVFPLLR